MTMAQLDAGRSLRILMAERGINNKTLQQDLGLSDTTISTLRRNKLISGRNLVMLADYFELTAAQFILKGEPK